MDTRPLRSASAPSWRVTYVDAAGSTNAVAAGQGVAGLVVVAGHQTAGRGRLDRGWETPAGEALTFSVVLDPGVPDARWPWVPLLTGVVVADVVRATTDVPAALKWPNDVLVGDRKLAGILVERVAPHGRPVAVVGVGLNVHQQDLPVPAATSLAREGAAVDRADLLEALLPRLADALADWRSPGGQERLRASYAERCATLGREVTVHLPGDAVLTGRAEDVDPHGRLVVRDADGVLHPVGAGDVVHVRPAPA